MDLRYGLRALRHHAWFTVVAALTLAFDIGTNTAIFQLIQKRVPDSESVYGSR